MGPVPLSRRALRLRHVHARLPVPALEGSEGDRRRSRDPELHPRGRERQRNRPAHPLRPPGDRRFLVDTGREVDGRDRARSGAPVHLLRLSLDVQRLLPVRGRVPAGVSRHRFLQGAGRASAALAAGSRLCRQEGGGDRQRRHRRDGRAVDGRDRGPRHHASALTHLRRGAAGAGSDRQQAAASVAAQARLHADALEERPARHVFLPDVQAQAGEGEEPDPGRRAPDAGTGLRCRDPLHAEIQSLGPEALPGAGRRSVPRHPQEEGLGRDRHDRDVHGKRASG